MSNYRVIELSQYTVPKPVESRTKAWVEYGDDNDFYQELIDARDSATHNAMINGITEMLYGRGLTATDASRKPEEWAQVVSLLSEDTLRCLGEDFYNFGSGFLQCIWDQGHNKIVEVYHTPTPNWRPEKYDPEKDEILGYYYHDDWANIKPKDQPKRYSALGKSKEGIEILCIKPYRSGYHYFTPPEYISALPYAKIEVEVANYHLNNILNGFSANTIINFNNGVPKDDEKDEIESKVKAKFSGSENAGNIVIAFNDGAENAATIESVQLNDAHNQYEFIAKEATRKILVSHRVTSPILVGLKDEGSSIGSNADELRMASQLFDNTVIKPMQRIIIEGLNKILSFNNISLDLYFKTAQPIEFTEVETDQISRDNVQRDTGVEMSKEVSESLDALDGDLLAELGEDESEEWELVDESEVDYETADDIEEMVVTANRKVYEQSLSKQETLLSRLVNLVSTGTARPNAKSEWDDESEEAQFKLRYEYSPRKASADSRPFCKKMVAASKLYRREDITRMSNSVVNEGWGPNGANTYDIFKYKGGGNCHHKWVRKLYMRKDTEGNIDVKSPIANRLITSIRTAKGAGYSKGVDPDYDLAKTAPKNMKNKGFLKPR